jgi:hypothetical protein
MKGRTLVDHPPSALSPGSSLASSSVAAIMPRPSAAEVTLVVAPPEAGRVARILRSAGHTVEAVPTWTGALKRLRERPRIAVMLVDDRLLPCTPTHALALAAGNAPDLHFVLLTPLDAESAELEVDPSIPYVPLGAAPVDLLLTVAFLHALGPWPPRNDVPNAWAPLLPCAREPQGGMNDR